MREHRHDRLALRLLVVLGCRHIHLAGIKLSMLIDNFITKRHDCLVTTGLFFPMTVPGIFTP
jgi:hypothetical protein